MRYGRFIIRPTLLCIPLTKHKFLEVEIGKGGRCHIFDLHINWTIHTDHSGPQFIFQIYKLFCFLIKVYDNRHWDYQNNCWQKTQ